MVSTTATTAGRRGGGAGARGATAPTTSGWIPSRGAGAEARRWFRRADASPSATSSSRASRSRSPSTAEGHGSQQPELGPGSVEVLAGPVDAVVGVAGDPVGEEAHRLFVGDDRPGVLDGLEFRRGRRFA